MTLRPGDQADDPADDAADDPAGEGLGARIWRAQRAVERAADACLAPAGLQATVFRLLRQLTREPGQSAADLARRLGLAPQSIALTVARAERDGLIERRAHPVHGRVLQLFVTGPGERAYRRGINAIRGLEQDLAADLDPQAAEQIIAALASVAARARRWATSGRPGQIS